MNEMFSFVEFVTFPPTRFTKKSSVILPSSSVIWQINNVAIKNWPKFVIHENPLIFSKKFNFKKKSMDLELFSHRPMSSPSVDDDLLTYLSMQPVTLLLSNFFLFLSFFPKLLFSKNSLNSKNTKLFVWSSRNFFFRKILRTEIF